MTDLDDNVELDDGVSPDDVREGLINAVNLAWKAFGDNGSCTVSANFLAWLLQEHSKLRSQLPTGMEHCTILFKECEKGHGRLTATNWIDHGCPWCQIGLFQSAIYRLLPLEGFILPDAPDGQQVNLVTTVGALRQLIAIYGGKS